MASIVDLFDHERAIDLNGYGLLLGDPTDVTLDGVTLNNWSAVATAGEIGEVGANGTNVAQLTIRAAGTDFIVPATDWYRVAAQSNGAAISVGNGSAVRAYERGGDGSKWLLVGRTDSNIPLVQQGEGFAPAGAVRVDVIVTEMSGGLVDRMIHGLGQRHLLCMQCDQDARPAAPPHGTDLRYTGVNPIASALSSGEVWYPSGNRGKSSTVKTWFAFGEAVFDDIRGVWVVRDVWRVVDGADANNIAFGRNWDGPWQTSEGYVVGGHHYARVRHADGSFLVRRIGTDGGPLQREWVPLTEQYVNGSAYRAEPYTVRTAFDFDPAEWNLLKFEWEWDETAGTDLEGQIAALDPVYQDRIEKIIDARSIVPSVQQTRRNDQFATYYHGAAWRLDFYRSTGMNAIRKDDAPGNSNDVHNFQVAWQFETSGATVAPPITHARFISRGNTTARGWLRTFVL